jgi:hypothetical protein
LFQNIFIISVPQTRFTLRNRFCERRGSEQAVKAVLPIENGVYFEKMKNMRNAGRNVGLKREEALAPRDIGRQRCSSAVTSFQGQAILV